MKKPDLSSKFFGILVNILILGAALTSCSGISVGIGGGGTSSPNDVRPTGTPLVQGVFNSQNGQTVSGTALVFNIGGANYVLRLEGITTPSESSLQVQLFSSDGQITNTLRAYSGNQNYSFTGSSGSATFSSVSVYSTINRLIYGTALLK